MSRINELLHHPSRLLSHQEESFAREHPKTTAGGLIVLLLALAGLIMMWPDIQRYMKMRRM